MSRLTEWLDHRMEVVAIETWKDLPICPEFHCWQSRTREHGVHCLK